MDNEILNPDDVVNNVKNDTLLYQNTPLLTTLIKLSYEEYAKNSGWGTQAIIIGLREVLKQFIEPICQQNANVSKNYLAYLEQFNQYNGGDFLQYPDGLEAIVIAMTHLLQCAIESYRALGYPKDYHEFLNLFESIFKNPSIIEHNHHRNVMLMMEQLRQKP